MMCFLRWNTKIIEKKCEYQNFLHVPKIGMWIFCGHREVTLPKCSLSSVQSRSGLINAIRIINPKIIEMEAEVNEIYQAMIDCDMLDELKKEFNKEIIQRIKNILHVKAFHHRNMKKSLQIHAGMKGDALEANMETLLDYVKELKTGFFKRYFMMKVEI